ncbi:TPA: hypothetical protein DDW35_10705, partial [Candidatus Sumerlaeota bacterium]|nr:hypothetical protein [Candidatus Sumerlaeota bacterium]
MLHKASTFKFVAALTMLMLFLVSVVGFAEEAATPAPPAAAATAAAPAAEPVIDPSGSNTGTAADITAKES